MKQSVGGFFPGKVSTVFPSKTGMFFSTEPNMSRMLRLQWIFGEAHWAGLGQSLLLSQAYLTSRADEMGHGKGGGNSAAHI